MDLEEMAGGERGMAEPERSQVFPGAPRLSTGSPRSTQAPARGPKQPQALLPDRAKVQSHLGIGPLLAGVRPSPASVKRRSRWRLGGEAGDRARLGGLGGLRPSKAWGPGVLGSVETRRPRGFGAGKAWGSSEAWGLEAGDRAMPGSLGGLGSSKALFYDRSTSEFSRAFLFLTVRSPRASA